MYYSNYILLCSACFFYSIQYFHPNKNVVITVRDVSRAPINFDQAACEFKDVRSSYRLTYNQTMRFALLSLQTYDSTEPPVSETLRSCILHFQRISVRQRLPNIRRHCSSQVYELCARCRLKIYQ